jgi:hypothetical protein
VLDEFGAASGSEPTGGCTELSELFERLRARYVGENRSVRVLTGRINRLFTLYEKASVRQRQCRTNIDKGCLRTDTQRGDVDGSQSLVCVESYKKIELNTAPTDNC